MECREVQNNLFAYMEREISPDDISAFEAHISGCESCTRILAGYRAMEAAIEAEKAIEPNPFASTRILQRLESEEEKHRPLVIPALRPLLATLVLFLALMTGFLIGNRGMMRTPNTTIENQQIEILKSDFHIKDFVDEDITLLTNY